LQDASIRDLSDEKRKKGAVFQMETVATAARYPADLRRRRWHTFRVNAGTRVENPSDMMAAFVGDPNKPLKIESSKI
jgi:hypothetical protein